MAGEREDGTDIQAPSARCLLSEAEFRRALHSVFARCVGCVIRLTVQDGRSETVATYESAAIPTTTVNDTRELGVDADLAVTCRCEIWKVDSAQSRGIDFQNITTDLGAIIDRYWGDRDPATMLPYLKSAAPLKQFIALARSRGASDQPIAILHTDLDRFKKINDDHGEPVGNTVLREFSDRFRAAFSEFGVPVRTGGEEFSAILYKGTITEIVQATEASRKRMEEEPFAAIGRANTCSIGLSLYPNGEVFVGVTNEDQILNDARNAERRAKEDGRNRTVLMGPSPAEKPVRAGTVDDLIICALAARRIAEADEAGPEKAFAAFVVDRMAGGFSDIDTLALNLKTIRGRLGLLVGDYDIPVDRPAILQGVVDSQTWATWVGRAVLLAAFRGGLALDPNVPLQLAVDAEGALSLKIGVVGIPLDAQFSVGTAATATIGKPFYPAGEEPAGGIGRKAKERGQPGFADPMSPTLLLPIGDEARLIAQRLRHVVSAIVDVDDRPARGGGLPDFWQSNVLRVIRACIDNPNIGTVLAIGDKGCALHTLEWLKLATGVSQSADLQRRLSLTSDKVEAMRARKLDIRVVDANLSSVIGALAQVVGDLAPIDFSALPEIDASREKSKRRLPIPNPDSSHRLSNTDGLRTRTLADAYPEAVQLIRGANDGFDFEEAHRGKFREFMGFKVVLTEPLLEMVPDYWASDQKLLETYYDNTFISPDGLFGKALQSPLKGGGPTMMKFAVDETAEALKARLPTRRINLPISPDQLNQPLGLSTIQIFPRCRGDEDRLEVVCVWRTVDALVGFPFSAYGSICWSRDFLKQVNDRLEAGGATRRASLTTLTYIALTFHMYLHEGDREIARTIVQDASL